MSAGKALGIWARVAELSLKQIAAQIGITKQALSRLLSGRGKPKRVTANAIARLTKGRIPADAWDDHSLIDASIRALAA